MNWKSWLVGVTRKNWFKKKITHGSRSMLGCKLHFHPRKEHTWSGKDMLDQERTCLIRKGGKCMKTLLFMELICRTPHSQENRQLLVDSHGKMPTFSWKSPRILADVRQEPLGELSHLRHLCPQLFLHLAEESQLLDTTRNGILGSLNHLHAVVRLLFHSKAV